MVPAAWITFVRNDEEVIKANLLLKSLKQVWTTKPFFLITGRNVTIQNIPRNTFDGVFPVQTLSGVDEELAAKIQCLELNFVQRLIFLRTGLLVLQNIDHHFDDPSSSVNIERKPLTISEIESFCGLKITPSSIDYNHLLNSPATATTDTSKCTLLFEQIDGIFLWSGNKASLETASFQDYNMINFENATGKQIEDLYKELTTDGNQTEINSANSQEFKIQEQKEPIAIVGMSCRLPGANNLHEFWDNLMNKKDSIVDLPDDRWLPEQGCAKVQDRKSIHAGFLSCPVDEADGKFFGMSPKEMEFTDPQQRFLLEVSWEALEDAAIDPKTLRGSNAGIFTGTWMQNYHDLIVSSSKTDREFFRAYLGTSYGATAGRMAYFYGTMGSNVATESGCSSSIVAVGLACKSLQNGNTNVALACGVNLLLTPFTPKAMESFTSPDGHSKAFDAKADGFGRAEGCGVLVLKRLSDAIRDGNRIHAMIRGYGEAQEGTSRSLGTPTVQCEALAMSIALKDAGVEPEDVQYVEAHGTGTPVGDPMEMSAIAQVYGKPTRDHLYVGSVKTNVGHTESCSGITGIIKTVLALKNQVIPPHRCLETLNPKIDLDIIPAIIPTEAVEWKSPRNGKPRIAGVSSFGITGTDAHVILQECPTLTSNKKFKPLNSAKHILLLSGKTDSALQEKIAAYSILLNTTSQNLKDVSFTNNTGRSHFPHRIAVIGQNCADVANNLSTKSFIKSAAADSSVQPKICFLFTGQGSQYSGMAEELYKNIPTFQKHFDLCSGILIDNHDIDIRNAMWDRPGDFPLINRTLYSQLSIFCVDYSISQVWKELGVFPDVVLGHSLGEFAAACCAGMLSLEDALKLVAERSKLIDSLDEGTMIVTQADAKKISSLLKHLPSQMQLDFAATNSSDQTVLAGSSEAVESFKVLCSNNNIKTSILSSSHAFHSSHMDAILDKYKVVADSVTNNLSSCHYVSAVNGSVLKEGETLDTSYWLRHTRDPVKFIDATSAAASTGCSVFLEVGPQPILSSFVLKNYDFLKIQDTPKAIPSLRKGQSDLDVFLSAIGQLYTMGCDLNMKQFYKGMRPNVVSLPHYPFQRKKFWLEISKTGGELLNATNEKFLHPLLGFPLPTATKAKVFQNSLSVEEETYIGDHVVGKHIIFPAAGYVEVALAAGHSASLATFEDFRLPYGAIEVKNLSVESPFGMQKDGHYHLQTVLDSDGCEEGWTSISIFRREGTSSEAQKWVRHSACEYSSAVSTSLGYLLPEYSALQALTNTEGFINTSEFYSALEEAQLKFGETFKSLQKVWKDPIEGSLLCQIAVPRESPTTKEYLTHPVAIDAMIQSIMFNQTNLQHGKVTLHVPIRIQKFTWLAADESQTLYVFVPNKPTDSSTISQAFLLSQTFNLLAVIEGVELVPTTAEAINAAIDNQKINLPTILEEIWTPETKHKGIKSVPEYLTIQSIIEAQKAVKNSEAISVEEREETKLLHEAISLKFQTALLELNFKAKPGESFTAGQVVQQCGIKPEFKLFCTRILDILTESGYLQKSPTGHWTQIKEFSSTESAQERISSIGSKMKRQKFVFHAINKIMPKTPKVLTGHDNILQELFGDGESSLAEGIYTENPISTRTNEISYRTISHLLGKCLSRTAQGKELRVLEIGAGTGGTTGAVLPAFQQSGINFSYTFTDLSAGFFEKARDKFKEYNAQLKFQPLDIAVDPRDQGFPPNYFDVIIAANVLHATKDMASTLRNVRLLAKTGAFVMIVEHFAPQQMIDAIFGHLEGYWMFTDFDLRPNHALMSTDKWERVLNSTGFSSAFPILCADGDSGVMLAQADSISVSNNSVYNQIQPEETIRKWVVFESQNSAELASQLTSYLDRLGVGIQRITFDKTRQLGKPIWTLRYDSKDDMKEAFENLNKSSSVEGVLYLNGLETSAADLSQISQPYLRLIQTISTLSTKAVPNIVVVTRGTFTVGDQKPISSAGGTLMGMTRTYKSEFPVYSCRTVDLEPFGFLEDDVSSIVDQMWRKDSDYFIAVRQGIRHKVQLNYAKLKRVPLSLPNSNRFCLQLPSTCAISDLTFVPCGKRELEETQVEILVKAAALNFRDVFAVLKPDEQFKNVSAVGTDFSGVVTSIGKNVTKFVVGDAVMGCHFGNEALPSQRVSNESEIVHLPSSMTFAEGATLPAVFATAYHCLIDVAKLSKGEKILIHTGSGGVGLVAIQVARNVGAEIFATAGNNRKRAYLKSLGVQNVFNSRSLEYKEEILKVTSGRGVDVVLNSLTGPGFKEASLDSLAKNGRFVEMSKLNVWSLTDVANLRPDVNYRIVDLTTNSAQLNIHLNDEMSKCFLENKVHPIPYVKFDSVYIREALTCLQKAKHIGKVVVMMPEMKLVHGYWEGTHTEFNDRSTYVITGGLGGIGLEAAKWMASEGAKHIVLTGRRQPQNDKAARIIEELSKDGVIVRIILGDVGKPEELRCIFDQIDMEMPPVRGIMHAAGCIKDALYSDISWEHFQTTLNAKVNGTLNLHELTSARNYRLEHFVLYSSMVSIMGSIGQSNHAAGNAFMDSFAHYRNAMGLPATSVNWGQWGQVGVAADMEIPAISPFTPRQAFASLKLLVSSHVTQAVVIDADFNTMKMVYRWMSKTYAHRIKSSTDSSSKHSRLEEVSSEEFWKRMDDMKSPEDKRTLLSSIVANVLKCILKFEESETIDPNHNFQEIGLDSLMMVEFKNILQSILGTKVVLNASDLADSNSVNLITRKIMSTIYEESRTISEEEYFEAMQKLSHLDVEVNTSLEISPVKTLLLIKSQTNFGQEILRRVAGSNKFSNIYCLETDNNLPKGDFKQNVKLIQGTVSSPMFGLDESTFLSLVKEVDVIIHCEARLTSPKGKRSQAYFEDLELAKQDGIHNLIDFAATGKVKQIYYASFLFPEGRGIQGGGVLKETLPNKEDLQDYLKMGYSGSRFVAERLFSQAIDKGIPCKIFRLPYTAGNSVTGEFSVNDQSHVFRKYISFMAVGMMPQVPIPFTILPIDFCADITLKIFMECQNAPSGVYNVTNPHKYSMKDFFEVSEQYGGKPMRSVELQEFMQEVGKDGDNPLIKTLIATYGDPVAVNDEASQQAYKRLADATSDINSIGKIGLLIPNYLQVAETPMEILKRDLKFVKDTGLFKQYFLQ